jgi:hypothetical protein
VKDACLTCELEEALKARSSELWSREVLSTKGCSASWSRPIAICECFAGGFGGSGRTHELLAKCWRCRPVG